MRSFCVASLSALLCMHAVSAQENRAVPIATTELSMEEALRTASTAVAKCKADGYRVVAIVLNPESNIQIFLRGDGTTSYAIDSARMKAYTLANLGPVRDMSTSSLLATSILGSSNANPQLSNIPGILLVGGAVMLVKDGKRAGVLGVSGAPGAQFDEVCALAGAATLK